VWGFRPFDSRYPLHMRKIWRKAKIVEEKKFRVNEQINVPEVFLIDENGVQIGKVTRNEALQRAQTAELDLVEVNPLVNPPVVKIIDYGQFKYEKDKKAHKQKVAQKKIDTKVIRLSVRIGWHDLEVRQDQAVKFFQKGHKLKIELILKGREKQHPEKAVAMINEFIKQLENTEGLNIVKEQDLTRMGGLYTIILFNKSN
jgi:translation initiation factor IF-3